MQATKQALEILNSLLRGELAATETYQQAMKRLDDDPGAARLLALRDEHRSAANTLRQQVHQCGGKPDQGSGLWGAWSRLVEATATLMGGAAALKALKEGEEHGIKDYEEALKQDDLPVECKSLIQTQLLPQTRQHVAELDQLMQAR